MSDQILNTIELLVLEQPIMRFFDIFTKCFHYYIFENELIKIIYS